MSSDSINCELATVSLRDSDYKPESEDLDHSITHLGNGGSKPGMFDSQSSDNTLLVNGSPNGDYGKKECPEFKADFKDPHSDPDFVKGNAGVCVYHENPLDSYCSSEQRLICSHCAIVGPCQGHIVTPVAQRATVVRNQLVDVCEKMQLQALRMERFVAQTLMAKERALQTEASAARERVVERISLAREALEEEEQRLLEAVQREEERVQQCLLTQRAHWAQALAALTRSRADLVHTLTNTEDTELVCSSQKIADRVEEAEGLGEPLDTEQLNLDASCSNSKLLLGLWANAVLLGPSAHATVCLTFDERTVSALLSLSADHRTLTFLPKRARQSPPYDPARFDQWPNALCSQALSSGTHRWVLKVSQSAAFKVGVCYASMERKGSSNGSRLGYNAQSWVLSHYEGDFSFCHAGRHLPLPMLRRPQKLGVLLDWPGRILLFFDPDSCAVLHAICHHFTAPLLPAFAVADHSLTLLH